jgi:hypothetical protein
MAITASYCKRNDAVELTKNTAAATFSVGLGDKPGEKVIILVENNNATASGTATFEVLAGDYLANVYGTLSVDVASEGATAIIGPLETVRYKNSASEVACAVTIGSTASGTPGATIDNVKVAVIKLP